MSCAAGKEHYHILLKVLVRSVLGKELGKRSALEGSENVGHHALASEYLRNINAVHDCSQHTDLIGLYSVNGFAAPSSPEIAAADYDSNLGTCIYKLFNLQCYPSDSFLVKSGLLFSSKRFAAEL